MKIVAVSGSLRPESSSVAVLRALLALAPTDVVTELYTGIGDLPYFSPDRDTAPAPSAVQTLRDAITGADAMVFCTPEYAHGMPGSLKNALDWLVGSGELVDKPVAALSASPSIEGGANARAWLVQTLEVMSANIVEEASFAVGLVRTKFDRDGNLLDTDTARDFRATVAALIAAV